MKNIKYSIGAVVGILVLFVVLGFFNLGMFKFFGPKYQNARREVFENTKSYVHGKTQDLARYYEQHQNAETADDKLAIEALVKMQFADFDESDIRSAQLRKFLTQIRGY